MFKRSIELMEDLKKKIRCDRMYYYELYLSKEEKVIRNKVMGMEIRNMLEQSIKERDCMLFWYEEEGNIYKIYSYADYGVVEEYVILKEEI